MPIEFRKRFAIVLSSFLVLSFAVKNHGPLKVGMRLFWNRADDLAVVFFRKVRSKGIKEIPEYEMMDRCLQIFRNSLNYKFVCLMEFSWL